MYEKRHVPELIVMELIIFGATSDYLTRVSLDIVTTRNSDIRDARVHLIVSGASDTARLNPLKRVIPLNSFGEEQVLCYFVIYSECHLRYVLGTFVWPPSQKQPINKMQRYFTSYICS